MLVRSPGGFHIVPCVLTVLLTESCRRSSTAVNVMPTAWSETLRRRLRRS